MECECFAIYSLFSYTSFEQKKKKKNQQQQRNWQLMNLLLGSFWNLQIIYVQPIVQIPPYDAILSNLITNTFVVSKKWSFLVTRKV